MKKDDFILKEFIDNAFDLKTHLMEFLSIKECDLDGFLKNGKMNLASLHPVNSSRETEDFYKEIVGEKHLADLAAWHISSKDYIADTLRLQQRFSGNLVLDFGGGIGTHALANAMSSKVKHVYFVDINQTNRSFVEYRANQLGLGDKLTFCQTIQETQIPKFDTIVCLDVLEHLSDPAAQLDIFYEIMDMESVGLFNWYFFKGEKNEYPFHIDNEVIIENFFKKLQSKFVELFHPILITTRAYRKI